VARRGVRLAQLWITGFGLALVGMALVLACGEKTTEPTAPVPQHRGEALATRDDPALGDGPVLVADAELALALVQI